MPWQRRPDWEYLPHLADREKVTQTAARLATEPCEEGQSAAAGVRGDNGTASTDGMVEHEPLELRQLPNEGGPTGEDIIRGRNSTPGAIRRTPTDPRQRAAADPRIRGHDNVPGPADAIGGGRAQLKLSARNAHLARSLADHAERVAKRDLRGDRPGQASASERMAALRRRITERRSAGEDSQRREAASDAQHGGALQAVASAGNRCLGSAEVQIVGDSIEEYKIHFGEAVEEDACRGRSSAHAARGNASAAAAAADAWHGGDLPGADDVGSHLSAR